MKQELTSYQESSIEDICEYVASLLKDALSDNVHNFLPRFDEPWAAFASSEDGIWVSVTEEDQYAGVVPWGQFVSDTLDSDVEILERYIPKLESLLKAMKKEVKHRT